METRDDSSVQDSQRAADGRSDLRGEKKCARERSTGDKRAYTLGRREPKRKFRYKCGTSSVLLGVATKGRLMGIRTGLMRLANMILRPAGAELVPYMSAKPWDSHFQNWVAEAEATGKDPNDVGDVEWSDDLLKQTLETHYLPYVHSDSVVLELGPGTGRLTRHIITRCREMILVDYSILVCRWLEKYLQGKGRFRIYQIHSPALPAVATASVDVILANGVFEHIDFDDLLCFLEEFHRVLRPGGIVSFNFDNLMTLEGMQWLQKFRGKPGEKCVFRFYHPDVMRTLGEEAGLRVLRLGVNSTRFAHVDLQKPASEAHSH